MAETARSLDLGFEGALPAAGQEASLVGELRAGSEEAYAYLVSLYQNPVFNLVSRIIEDRSDAADVLQDVFLKVLRGISGFNGQSSLKTWIYRIAVHEASNHRRGWLRRRVHEAFSLDESARAQSKGLGIEQCRSETPYETYEHTERHDLVERALASLASPYRTVVVLREIEGLSYEEIAQVLGVAEGTVKSRLLRGRALLRRKLASQFGKEHV